MSIMKPPPNTADFDQSKAYHLAPSQDNWTQSVVCGELVATGIAHYPYFTCLRLHCLTCGASVDVSDFDKLWIGNDSELGETW